jgi:hypothetical protein
MALYLFRVGLRGRDIIRKRQVDDQRAVVVDAQVVPICP